MLVSASFYSKILWIHVPSVRFAVCRITFSSRITTDLPTTSLLKLLFTGRSKMTKLLQKMNCYHWIRTFLKCGVKMPSFAKNCASTADPIISTEQAIGRHTWSIHAKLKDKDTKQQACHSTVMIIFLYFSHDISSEYLRRIDPCNSTDTKWNACYYLSLQYSLQWEITGISLCIATVARVDSP